MRYTRLAALCGVSHRALVRVLSERPFTPGDVARDELSEAVQ